MNWRLFITSKDNNVINCYNKSHFFMFLIFLQIYDHYSYICSKKVDLLFFIVFSGFFMVSLRFFGGQKLTIHHFLLFLTNNGLNIVTEPENKSDIIFSC